MTRGTPIPETMTLRVPFRMVKRGGRKEMQVPTDTRAHRIAGEPAKKQKQDQCSQSGTHDVMADKTGFLPQRTNQKCRRSQLHQCVSSARTCCRTACGTNRPLSSEQT